MSELQSLINYLLASCPNLRLLNISQNFELLEGDSSVRNKKLGVKGSRENKKQSRIKGFKLSLFENHDRAIAFYSKLLTSSIGTLEDLDISAIENQEITREYLEAVMDCYVLKRLKTSCTHQIIATFTSLEELAIAPSIKDPALLKAKAALAFQFFQDQLS